MTTAPIVVAVCSLFSPFIPTSHAYNWGRGNSISCYWHSLRHKETTTVWCPVRNESQWGWRAVHIKDMHFPQRSRCPNANLHFVRSRQNHGEVSWRQAKPLSKRGWTATPLKSCMHSAGATSRKSSEIPQWEVSRLLRIHVENLYSSSGRWEMLSCGRRPHAMFKAISQSPLSFM